MQLCRNAYRYCMLRVIPGFHASDASEYAAQLLKVFDLNTEEKLEMRLRARKNARRFSETVFSREWASFMGCLIDLYQQQN